MPSIVAILEDNERRCSAMRACLSLTLPSVEVVFFESAPDIVAWLEIHQAEVALISLDFDLPIRRSSEGVLIDYGTGEAVAEYLASMPPTCSVIIHSSNAAGAFKMDSILRAAGWPTVRVYPADDLAWIGDSWIGEVQKHRTESAGLHP